MIPVQVDHALLHEHSFMNSKDIRDVLDPTTFSNNAGFKSIKDHGLGYYNYYLALDSDVYESSNWDVVRAHIYDNFNIYLFFCLIAALVWFGFMLSEFSVMDKIFKKRRGRKIRDSNIEYHHVKV